MNLTLPENDCYLRIAAARAS